MFQSQAGQDKFVSHCLNIYKKYHLNSTHVINVAQKVI